jgi:preprotein translocase subunit YajC
MTLLSTGEKVVLALRGAPMLMTLLTINLTVLGMVTFLTVQAAQMRQQERGEMLAALRTCVQFLRERQ